MFIFCRLFFGHELISASDKRSRKNICWSGMQRLAFNLKTVKPGKTMQIDFIYIFKSRETLFCRNTDYNFQNYCC